MIWSLPPPPDVLLVKQEPPFRRGSEVEYLKFVHINRETLTMALQEAAINTKLQGLGTGWQRQGKNLVLRETFGNFVDAMAFAQAITPLAETQGHHPDLEIGWGRCTVLLTTHDAGGLTEKDFSLAKAIDRIR